MEEYFIIICVIAALPKIENNIIGESKPRVKDNRREIIFKFSANPPEIRAIMKGKEQGLVENTIAIITPNKKEFVLFMCKEIFGSIFKIAANPNITNSIPNANLIFSKSIFAKNMDANKKIDEKPNINRSKDLMRFLSWENLKSSKGYNATIQGVKEATIPEIKAPIISNTIIFYYILQLDL